ncbi:PstS family phosphate ABC transporter substrate-binding protein [Lederbergia panacisoli]|uniref:PstS family phosphate ABC transporter substrate-binding protein n=1 Tax=Lederbergia panacisoli TaxID=1255251 RepID=UPI00214ACDEB|nr:PstS family phosphate ABC transporter substrate-binding protein [Lederbergia panacisoli]MCR2822422.1 PstS family phosphate ABC transporter substrate-binding protein [Lederbergia panacisoli]
MKLKSLIATFTLSSALILAACGNGDGSSTNGNGKSANENDSTSKVENNESEKLSGSVGIDGSSTVFPIMEAVSEEYLAVQPDVKAPVGVSGTGGGFKKFIAGETDISNASRPIKDEESQLLKDGGIPYTEFEIAYDGLSVVVNKDNDFVDQLTIEELKKMWIESGNVKTWADVRDGWPEESISFFSPGTDSGTYDYWNEVILEDEQMRKDATLSEDDNVLVQGVIGDKGGIGFFGFSYYIENKDNLKVVPIVNSKGEAVTPDHDTIMNGVYEPLSRPLYFYVRNDALSGKPQVYDYVKFALENAGELAEEVGYISLKDDEYAEALNKLEESAK